MCTLSQLPVAKKQFWGLLYQPAFTDESQMWCAIADPRCWLTYQISSRLVIGLFPSPSGCKKNPIFAVFWTSAFSGVANWQQSEKVEHGCTTTNLPLSNGTKIVSVLQRLHGKIGRTLSDVQKCDGQTEKQTDKKTQRFWPPRRRAKSKSHQTWHDNRGPRARYCTSKTFPGLMHSFVARGR